MPQIPSLGLFDRTLSPTRQDRPGLDAMRAMRRAWLQFERKRGEQVRGKAPNKLGSFDRRVLAAVCCVVTSYWRLEHRVAVGLLAAWVYDVEFEDVSGWQREHVQESLRRLAAADVIMYRSKRGRPESGAMPLAVIGLPRLESAPGTGMDWIPKTPPRNGKETTPGLPRKSPTTGGHTEESSDESSDESEGPPARESQPADPVLEKALKHFAPVAHTAEPHEIRELVAEIRQRGYADAQIPILLGGCTWPSEVRKRLQRTPAVPPVRTSPAVPAPVEPVRSPAVDELVTPPPWLESGKRPMDWARSGPAPA